MFTLHQDVLFRTISYGKKQLVRLLHTYQMRNQEMSEIRNRAFLYHFLICHHYTFDFNANYYSFVTIFIVLHFSGHHWPFNQCIALLTIRPCELKQNLVTDYLLKAIFASIIGSSSFDDDIWL